MQALGVDFARAQSSVPRVSWGLLSCAVLAAAVAGNEVWLRLERVRALDEQIVRLQAQTAAVQSQAHRAQRASADNTADRALRADALRIERDLDRPWWPLLDVLEGKADAEVHLVQLSFDPEFKRANLQIEARTLDQMFAYMHRLAGAPGVGRVGLTQHEWRDINGAHVVSARLAIDAGNPIAPVAVSRTTLAAAAPSNDARKVQRP